MFLLSLGCSGLTFMQLRTQSVFKYLMTADFGNSATRRLGFGPSFWELSSLLLKCCASFSSCLDVMHRDPESIHVVSQHLTEKLC